MTSSAETIVLDDSARCPCLSGETYGSCCGAFHRGQANAPTAVALMRSRYSAFALGDSGYLVRTWHPSTRPRALDLDREVRWFRLDIEGTTRGGLLDSEGTVEFTAHYRSGGRAERQHEVSRFVRVDRRWVYLSEVVTATPPR